MRWNSCMSVCEGSAHVVVVVVIACSGCSRRRRWWKLCAPETLQQLIFIVRIFSCIVENVRLNTLKREMEMDKVI